jgi:hypothetical protein
MADVTTWEKVAATFTAVGGVGAMLGAGAAWRAASKSAEAARDARDALAASLKPQVQLFVTQYSGDEPVVARAVVVGPLSPAGLAGVLPATDVLIQFNLASGKQGSASTPILQPNASFWAREPPYLNVVIGQPSDYWPPPDGDHVIVTVLFSDVRKAASYRLSQSMDLRRSADPAAVSFQNATEPTETRITP